MAPCWFAGNFESSVRRCRKFDNRLASGFFSVFPLPDLFDCRGQFFWPIVTFCDFFVQATCYAGSNGRVQSEANEEELKYGRVMPVRLGENDDSSS
jgi:hypothetical protein